MAYAPLAVVMDGSHFDDPTPTPNEPSGPIACTENTIHAQTMVSTINIFIFTYSFYFVFFFFEKLFTVSTHCTFN